MSNSKITIEKWNPAGFAECLQGLSGQVKAAGESIAARATANTTKGSGFHVEMATEARFQDSVYDVSRPICRVVADDDESSREEYRDLVLTKAVSG